MRILEGKKLKKDFGGLAAISDVDFHIQEGEIVGLIGPNGAGKTTLFNMISGSLTPTSGTILLRKEKITGFKPYEICRRGLSRTFQLVDLFPHLSVLENVLVASLFGRSKGIRKSHAVGISMELLNFVGLSGMENAVAKELTVGNQKRLELSRALATHPDLLLLDELMAGLNPTEVTDAIDLILKIREKGITIFMIEHVMKAIMGLSDRIIVLHYGKKLAEGTPQEIAGDRMIKEVYLGT
jgi:branched-chain amino acid transport system ATP-binding protein